MTGHDSVEAGSSSIGVFGSDSRVRANKKNEGPSGHGAEPSALAQRRRSRDRAVTAGANLHGSNSNRRDAIAEIPGGPACR
jgi:hypothetical protein